MQRAEHYPLSGQAPQSRPFVFPVADECTALVIEQNNQLRHLIGWLLRRKGFNVLAAKYPVEALWMGQHHPAAIDLLIADRTMPGLDGEQVAQRLWSENPELRVVFLSQSESSSTAAKMARSCQKWLSLAFLTHRVSRCGFQRPTRGRWWLRVLYLLFLAISALLLLSR